MCPERGAKRSCWFWQRLDRSLHGSDSRRRVPSHPFPLPTHLEGRAGGRPESPPFLQFHAPLQHLSDTILALPGKVTRLSPKALTECLPSAQHGQLIPAFDAFTKSLLKAVTARHCQASLTSASVDSPAQRPSRVTPARGTHAQPVGVGGDGRARARARPRRASGRATHARAAAALRAAAAPGVSVGQSAGWEARSGARAATTAMAAEEEEVGSADTCER